VHYRRLFQSLSLPSKVFLILAFIAMVVIVLLVVSLLVSVFFSGQP